MTHAADTLSAQVVQLPPEERMQVVERILDQRGGRPAGGLPPW
jgi:hypothetical protein